MWCSSGLTADLGIRGPVFPIIERDLVSVLRESAQPLDAVAAQERVLQSLRDRPHPAHLVEATEHRRWAHDPTIHLKQAIVDGKGSTVHAAGTPINPLAHRGLQGALVFIDGNSAAQVAWALTQPASTRLILVAGDVATLRQHHDRVFYVDQHDALTERFGIQALPARVQQDGLTLMVEEVAL